MPNIINVSIYSVSPLPNSLRSEFELPSWPYSNSDGSLPTDVAEYFRKYGIFYYRDSITKDNILRLGLITPGYERLEVPIDIFSSSCYIDYANRTFAIVPWWPQCSKQFKDECFGMYGDTYAWTLWNERRTLKGYNSRFIKSSSTATKKVGKAIRSSNDFR